MPLCPCGSGKEFDACCGRYLAGAPAPTAEALMRSRYTAYAMGEMEYIAQTYASETRPPVGGPADDVEWLGLEIRKTSRGDETDATGTVEFVARFRQGGQAHQLHEISNFRREGGEWVYVDGVFPDTPAAPTKVGRNDPCPCGSGKKYKKCCGG